MYHPLEQFYYKDLSGKEKQWCFAFVQGKSSNEIYITQYNQNEDTYTYQRSTDEWGDLMDYSAIMWCPPVNWVKPIIYWNNIWSEMDYRRTKIRRPYIYYPEYVKNGITFNAYIQFLKPRI
tara:strand:+ start:4800 stop:5162 length:363 start_codon:yes stop_codon:yes gene_type:complete